PSLRNAPNQELFQQLLSANSFNQEQARRVLTERGKAIEKDLARWTEQQKTDEGRLQALWMYQSLDAVQPQLLAQVLKAKDGRIRAAAVRVTSAWHNRLNNASELLGAAIKDEPPRVRLEAARGLATIPAGKSAELVLSVLDKPMDSFLDYAIW